MQWTLVILPYGIVCVSYKDNALKTKPWAINSKLLFSFITGICIAPLQWHYSQRLPTSSDLAIGVNPGGVGWSQPQDFMVGSS